MNYYTGSINDAEFKKTRGYMCGAFEGAPVASDKMELAFMFYDELKNHIGDRHRHDKVDEFGLVLEGSIEMQADNDLLKLGKGEFFFKKAGTSSCLENVDKGTVVLVVKAPSVPEDKIQENK